MLIRSQSNLTLFSIQDYESAELQFRLSPFGVYQALHLLNPHNNRWCLCGLYHSTRAATNAIANCHVALAKNPKKFRFSSPDKETSSLVRLIESLAE